MTSEGSSSPASTSTDEDFVGVPMHPQLTRVLSLEVGSRPNSPNLRRSPWRAAADTVSSVSQIFTDIIPSKVNGMVSSDKYHKLLGISLALVSGLCLTWYSFIFKTMKDDVARTTVIVTRGTLQFLFFFLGARLYLRTPLAMTNVGGEKSKDGEPSMSRWECVAITLSTALVGGVRLCLIIISLALLPMAMVHTILNGSPVLVMLLSHFMLTQDRLSGSKILGGGLLLTGLVLTFQPYQAVSLKSDAFGYGTSICALVFSSLGSVLSKKLKGHIAKPDLSAYIGASIAVWGLVFSSADAWVAGIELNEMTHGVVETDTLVNMTTSLFPGRSTASLGASLMHNIPSHTNLTCVIEKFGQHLLLGPAAHPVLVNATAGPDLFSLVGEATITGCATQVPTYFPTGMDVWAKIIFVGLLGSMQQFCLIAAVQYDLPSRVTMIRSSSIIVSFLVQETLGIEDQPATWDQYMGALIIFLGITLVALEGQVLEFFRRCCCCLSRRPPADSKADEAPSPGAEKVSVAMTMA